MNWLTPFSAVRERVLPRDQVLSLGQLAVLGALVGGLAGLAISALHWLIDAGRTLLAPAQERMADSHSAATEAFVITAGGALLLGLLFQLFKPRRREGGFVHIIERLTYHQGQFPFINVVLQFLGTAIATVTHQAVGREGASAHMGAAAGSWLGTRLDIPTASVRTLVGCGAAAGIAASFNTPLAGVIFIMEVIVVEYSVASLAPSIVAAVCANAVAHLWLQSHPALVATDSALASMTELPFLALMGIVIGLLARLYLDVAGQATLRMRRWPAWVAMTAVGLVTGAGAVAASGLVDNGFDVINSALGAELDMKTAATLAALMLLCSALAIAAGLPGGVIMPCMLSGACIGLVIGLTATMVMSTPISPPGVYALLGLGAMLAAVLQAPLTALVLLVELSSRTDILLPAMMVVIAAVLTARQPNRAASVFALVLRNRGLDYRNDPISQSLRRISVMAAMNRHIARCPSTLSLTKARELLAKHPEWLLITPESGPRLALPAADLLHACNSVAQESDHADDTSTVIDLTKIPGDRRRLGTIHLRASAVLADDW
ncbi:MAG: chloride channel protein, partial [Oceanococcaceae bacterium]